MSLLGFNAVGRFALGQIGTPSTVVPVALTASLAGMARARGAATAIGAMQARATGMSRAADTSSAKAAISARIEMMAKAKTPAGFALPGKISGMMKMKAPGGIAINGRIRVSSSALPDIHVDGKVFGSRKALLLNGTSPVTATFWKGE